MALEFVGFAQLWVLWVALGLAAVAIAVGWWWGVRTRADREPEHPVLVARADRVRALPGYQAAVRRQRVVLSSLVVLGLAALAVTGFIAARPQSMHFVQPENANRDIVLCLDVSGSMQDVVVETIEVFEKAVTGFEGERIGLTIFNASAVQIFPLTDDYSFVQRELARIKASFDFTESYPEHWAGTLSGPGSSLIGDGLTSCTIGFGGAGEERSRTIILATDNEEQGAATVSLDEAAAYAKAQQVRVYAINPADASATDESGNPEVSAELRQAMRETGGQAYGLRDQTAVPEIIAKVQRQEAKILQGEQKLALADAPNVWIGALAAISLVWITIAWRARL